MLTASIVTLSAVVLACRSTCRDLWPGFQVIGDGSGRHDFAANAVLLGTIMIVFTTVINALGVKLMAAINSAGVFIELIAAVLIAVLLAVHINAVRRCSSPPTATARARAAATSARS